MPISEVLGFDPVWFGILMLINLEMGQITPPFGMLLFVMKSVTPRRYHHPGDLPGRGTLYCLRRAGDGHDYYLALHCALAAGPYRCIEPM
jgi:hypothetical protein